MNLQLKRALLLFLLHTCVFIKVQASTDDAFDALYPFSELMHSGFDSIEEAKEECDNHVSCAGISSIYDDSMNDTLLYAHSFLPQDIDTEQTYHSSRNFTIHSGLVHRGDILLRSHDGMTIPEAKIYCQYHQTCVAFTYPVHSMDLNAPDNIVFVSSINGFSDDGLGKWRTYISNDLNKAKYVNETSIEYNDSPYPVCCEEKETPTMEDIRALDTMERISCNISREEFYEKYEKTRTPVILVGCDEHWKAKERWTIDKLMPRFSNDTKWRAEIEDDEDNSRDFVTWGEIVDRRATNRDFYIFDNEFQSREENKQLEEDFECPGPLQGADVYGHLKDFRTIDAYFRWFLVAPRGTGSFPHVDPQATDAWNSLVTGHKWWVLYPDAEFDNPKQLKCDDYCSDEKTEKGWYTSVGINALRNECSNEQFPQHVLQKAGETIYVPYGRYHAVFNMEDTTCITANFGSAANLYMVWHEIVIDGEQHWKRAYYQLFDKEQRKQIRDWNLWPVENIDFDKYKAEKSKHVSEDDDDDDDDDDVDVEYEEVDDDATNSTNSNDDDEDEVEDNDDSYEVDVHDDDNDSSDP